MLSANGQFFVGVQVTVSLLFNSQLRLYKYGVFFYNSPFCFRQNQKLLNQYGTLSLFPGRTRLMDTCVLGCHVASTVLLAPKPFGGH